MRNTLAIAKLTIREGFRMRVVVVLLLVLAAILVALPGAVRGDGTLAGRLQTFLSYSFTAVGALLSLSTIFLSASTLTRELQSRTMHMLAVKPVTRMEILAGKWIGVCALNLIMLALSAGVIYGFAAAIKERPYTFRRDELNIRDAIWTARLAVSPTAPDFAADAEELWQARDQQGLTTIREKEELIRQFTEELRNEWLRVPPGQDRLYDFDNLLAPESDDTAYQIRYKVRAAPLPMDEMARALWLFVDPATRVALMNTPFESKGRSSEMHQFLIRAKPVVRDGKASLVVASPWVEGERGTTLFFEGPGALQLLYKVGSFEVNFLKNVLMIFARLSFIAAVGVLFGTFASFPVACFCTSAIFVLCLFSSWLLDAAGANLEVRTDSIDPYGQFGPGVRQVLVPLLRVVLPDLGLYDGTGRLIDGLYIPDQLLLQAIAHTLLFGAVLLVIPAWLIFGNKEIAEVQV